MSASAPAVGPSQRLHLHREEVLALIRARGASNPRVFGSVARGTDRDDSDIDILVTVDPERAWEFVSLARELGELLDAHVDVVSDRGLKPKHEQLLREAVPL